MDIRNFDINRLAQLNDFLTQTEVILRQRPIYGAGLTHSPYYYGGTPFGIPVHQGFGVDQVAGLSHSPYNYPVYQNMLLSGGFGAMPAVGATYPTYPTYVDPFVAQRGLSHTPAIGAWQQWAELARQQQLQAFVARQQAYEAMCRNTMPF